MLVLYSNNIQRMIKQMACLSFYPSLRWFLENNQPFIEPRQYPVAHETKDLCSILITNDGGTY